ncbi:MAG: thioredoxin domain-containing protein, partial [Ignavibacteriae bacterium]|nr:thioredoxin domain-containing protein [Ignavibacteriota bacterium]
MQQGRTPNRLIEEKSPYLLQHAFNPVEWYAWGEEAFAKARAEQKPIFLSIGYSTCHWCHVMEHESFEHDSIAAIMNQYFVSIKVDREERPDVDKIYMSALQAMGQNGGWPMSMFLTPDLKPFFGGTYFPPETRYGRIGFPELLTRIHHLWMNQREKILESADGLTTHLKELSAAGTQTTTLRNSILDTTFAQFDRSYDPLHGGFGDGPKFPRPVVFNFLLRYHYRTGEQKALQMSERTLRAMSAGGMYDHIGGGFHRYSVDGEWRVPHFEKMLYDQAQLVNSYVDLFQITKDPYYARIIREVLEYVLRDMTSAEGGFYSAEDADSPKPEDPSEQGEGACYVWLRKEILDVLGTESGDLFCFAYGVEDLGNALMDPQQEFTGKNILYIAHPVSEVAQRFGMTEEEVESILAGARKKLFNVRSKRPRPHLDDKILTSWNGLMISALARAYQVLDDPTYLKAAERAAEFVMTRLYDGKMLIRRYRDGESKYEAHLDDYSFLVHGLLDLYESSLNFRWLRTAIDLTEKSIEIFWDASRGGFFDTSGKDSSILVRMKELYDGAEPTGNSMAVMNLLRLSQMTDNPGWRTKAEGTLRSYAAILEKQPFSMPQMVSAFDFSLEKVKQIIVAGERHGIDTRR